jgi:hypothetical protein
MRKCVGLLAGISLSVFTSQSNGAASNNAANIPEYAGYREAYRLAIPSSTPSTANGGGWNTTGALDRPGTGYSVNNSAAIATGSFDRVAYYMELTGATGANFPNGWIWVSFDSEGFTDRADRIGVPSKPSTAVYQQNVSDMTVYSNVPGIITGTAIATGNIEFWPFNYTGARHASLSPANAQGTFDFGDTRNTSGDHATLQIHNYDTDGASGNLGQTLLAYNHWGAAAQVAEVGIGNNLNTTQNPDYTLTNNASSAGAWSARTLQVFVTPEPSSLAAIALLPVLLFRRNRSVR